MLGHSSVPLISIGNIHCSPATGAFINKREDALRYAQKLKIKLRSKGTRLSTWPQTKLTKPPSFPCLADFAVLLRCLGYENQRSPQFIPVLRAGREELCAGDPREVS
jgi:hypothetical protein